MKRRLIRNIFLIILIILFMKSEGFSQSTEGIKIAKMKVSVWPEYDDPRVLVIQEPLLESSTKFPLRIGFLVPKDAEIAMACELAADGNHGCRPYELTDRGEFNELSYEVSSRPTLFLEYYYNPFKPGGKKEFDFFFKSPYEIENLEFEVQQPLRSSDFKVNPPSSQLSSDNQGFKYYHYKYNKISSGKNIKLGIAYFKDDSNPSVSKKKGAEKDSSEAGGTRSALIILLSIFAGISVAVGGYLFVSRRNRYKNWQSAKLKPPRIEARAGNKKRAKKEINFCQNCGNKIEKGDNFCSACGSKL